MADVRRPEIPLRIDVDLVLLDARWRGELEGTTIVVMPVGSGGELPRSHEPACLAVTKPLRRLGEREAECTEALVGIVHLRHWTTRPRGVECGAF